MSENRQRMEHGFCSNPIQHEIYIMNHTLQRSCRVIHNQICAKAAHKIEIGRRGSTYNLRALPFRQLDREQPHSACRSLNPVSRSTSDVL